MIKYNIKKNNTKKYIIRINKIVIILIIILFVSLSNLNFGLEYWEKTLNPKNVKKTQTITIGAWHYGVKLYDDVNRIRFNEGDRVLKNGIIYTVIKDSGVNVNDPNYDPEIPNTDAGVAMAYIENTPEYRSFNRYQIGDYVQFEGKIYQRRWRNHNPNLISQTSPAQSSSDWREIGFINSVDPEPWYRYKIYSKGDIVQFRNGKNFEMIQDSIDQEVPPLIGSSSFWKLIS